ncbi:hypothetical protein FHW67_000914 [Herbaspirillum sp. Sphag1AN]|uniref:hypothetical protein n=1 Tax=unclassified Herbaspirillum TaxID=2624150 RepID=UPI001621E6C7|nr:MULTISPECIES: hypothetical protein [unclassified Herbaspirillum]MBB3211666.1 hypothetical protein [Herbaspirillum sp. Sphag1AN]MBB3245066.1 hypothetical protein [Herbaspirillum sp. Sphag64]
MAVLMGARIGGPQGGSHNPNLSRDADSLIAIYPFAASDTAPAVRGTYRRQTQISVPARRQLRCRLAPGYFEDYYFRMHLRPGLIDLGSVASEQSHTIEIWNAGLTPNHLMSSVSTGAQGMRLLGPIPAPTWFAANESRIYTLSVKPDGPPTVNAVFLFTFSHGTASLRASGRRIVAWIFAPNWTRPVIERLEWLTDVMQSHAGHEQRVRLRAGPRRSVEYSVLVGCDSERVHLENLLLSWQAKIFGLPVWTDVALATEPLLAGSTSIALTTAGKNLTVGGLLGLVCGMAYEFAEITDVLPSSVTIKSPLIQRWPTGSKILPVLPARIQNELGLIYLSNAIAQATVRFQFEDEYLLPNLPETPDYRAYPVLLTPSNWAEDIASDYSRKCQELDFLTGRRMVDDLSGIATVRRTHHWFLNGRTQIMAFRTWLENRAGRLGAFWLPSFLADLKVLRPISAFDAAITVENRAYTTNVPAVAGRRDIMITTLSGTTYYRRITGSSVQSASAEQIAIDHALGCSLLPEEIVSVSFMKLVRLDSDAVEICHHTDALAEASISLQSLRED